MARLNHTTLYPIFRIGNKKNDIKLNRLFFFQLAGDWIDLHNRRKIELPLAIATKTYSRSGSVRALRWRRREVRVGWKPGR